MLHDNIFGECEPKEDISSEEFIVYKWVNKQLYKHTYTRKYWPGSRLAAADSFKSEALL